MVGILVAAGMDPSSCLGRDDDHARRDAVVGRGLGMGRDRDPAVALQGAAGRIGRGSNVDLGRTDLPAAATLTIPTRAVEWHRATPTCRVPPRRTKGDGQREQRCFHCATPPRRPLRHHRPRHARGVPRPVRRALPRAGLARRRARQRRDRERRASPTRTTTASTSRGAATRSRPATSSAPRPRSARIVDGRRLRHRARAHAHRRVRDPLRAAQAPSRRSARRSSTPPTASTSTRAARRPATRSTRASSALAAPWTDYLVTINPRTSRRRARSAASTRSACATSPASASTPTLYAPDAAVSADESPPCAPSLDVAADAFMLTMVAEFGAGEAPRASPRGARPRAATRASCSCSSATGRSSRRCARRRSRSASQKRIRWAGYRRDIPAVLAASDALVLCSEREGLNRSVLEAMASGKPVIGTETRGIADAITPETGWLVRQERPRRARCGDRRRPPRDRDEAAAAALPPASAPSPSSPSPASSTPTRSCTVKRSHRVYDAVKRVLDIVASRSCCSSC